MHYLKVIYNQYALMIVNSECMQSSHTSCILPIVEIPIAVNIMTNKEVYQDIVSDITICGSNLALLMENGTHTNC